ncbi:hypothetical protein WG66_013026 [Moniliophthora roreri]|nr:hypothetical protein WG66_013026 [Moniliophthora roreri]
MGDIDCRSKLFTTLRAYVSASLPVKMQVRNQQVFITHDCPTHARRASKRFGDVDRLTMGCENGMLPSSGKLDAVNDSYTRSRTRARCTVHGGKGSNMPMEHVRSLFFVSAYRLGS